MGRYDGKREMENREDVYEELLEERGVPFIRQFGTANLSHPTPEERKKVGQGEVREGYSSAFTP